MTQGKFITIEGIEGAGKSTILDYMQGYFADLKIDAIFTREPGGTEIGEEIRNVLLHTVAKEVMQPETELLLMFAARVQHIHHVILPALTSGKWVVSDRFVDASYAYQGGGRHINEKHIAMLDQWLVQKCYPQLTILLDLSPECGFDRTTKRGNKRDRIEQEELDFFARVRESYLARAAASPDRIKRVNASDSLLNVQNQIKQILDESVACKQ